MERWNNNSNNSLEDHSEGDSRGGWYCREL